MIWSKYKTNSINLSHLKGIELKKTKRYSTVLAKTKRQKHKRNIIEHNSMYII